MLPALARYVRQHHLGLIAVAIASTGTAYAVTIPRNSVGTKQVINRSLLAADFKRGQLPAGAPGPQGAPGSAGAPGATGPQGPPGPSTGAAGGDLTGSFPNPEIGARKVGADELAFDAVNGQHVLDGSVLANDIQSHATTSSLRAIGPFHIQDDAVTDAHLADNAVQLATMADGSVGSAEVIDASNAAGLRKADLGVISTSATVDPPSVAAGSCTEDFVTAATDVGDMVIAMPRSDLGGAGDLVFVKQIRPVGGTTIGFMFCNADNATIDLGAVVWDILVLR